MSDEINISVDVKELAKIVRPGLENLVSAVHLKDTVFNLQLTGGDLWYLLFGAVGNYVQDSAVRAEYKLYRQIKDAIEAAK